MESLSKYFSNAVKTALSTISPYKVVSYSRRQYETEYIGCEILYEYQKLFLFLKVANHFDMTYVPAMDKPVKSGGSGLTVSSTSEETPYAYSLFRYQGDEKNGAVVFHSHVEVLHPLHVACLSLNLALDRVQLEKITAMCREHVGWNAAHVAASLSWSEVFYSAALKCILNNYDAESQMTPLRIAIASNDTKLVNCLLGLRVLTLTGVDADGNTVLHAAASACSQHILLSLLGRIDHQLNVNAINQVGNTALYMACVKPSRDCVAQLLNAGADPLVGLNELPLQLCVSADSLDCVELIYQHCPESLNIPQQSNSTYPIHLAPNDKIFRRLCELGANLDAQDGSGMTVLHLKVLDNDLESVLYLLTRGADPNLSDTSGASPLHYAITHNASIHIIRALLIFEADVNALNDEQQTPRHLLCSNSIEYIRSPDRDLALYTLHAIGADRCLASMKDCTIGCMDQSRMDFEGFESFDGTAPKIKHNVNEDAANLFEEIFFPQTPPPPQRQQPSDNQSTNDPSTSTRLRRHTHAYLSVRCPSRQKPAHSEDLALRSLSPVVNSKADGAAGRRARFSLQTSTSIDDSYVEQTSRPSPTSSVGRDRESRLGVESDPEVRFPMNPAPEMLVSKSPLIKPTVPGLNAEKLRFIPRECVCDENFLKSLHAWKNPLTDARPTKRMAFSEESSSSCSSRVVSPINSTHTLNRLDVGDDISKDTPQPDSSTCSWTQSQVSFRADDEEDSDNCAPSQSRPRQRNASSSWRCGPHGHRVLSVDGGGIRGLVLVQTLRALERITGKRAIEFFDWVMGTSTGGILALMLIRGKCLRCCRNLLFTFKHDVFYGRRPYAAEGLETVIRRELGENTKMTDLKHIRVAITTLLSDRCPPVLHIFRNYLSPRTRLNKLLQATNKSKSFNGRNGPNSRYAVHTPSPRVSSKTNNKYASENNLENSTTATLTTSSSVLNFFMRASGFISSGDSVPSNPPLETESGHKFKPVASDSEQFVWQVARATGAAPTYFRPCGRFLDGGLISNNPTLDLLTELQEMHMVQQLQQKPVTPLAVVVSLGTGRMPVEPIETVDVFRPQTLMETFRSAMGFSSLGRIIVEVATMAEGPIVDRASAWCASLGVPFFRFSPPLSLYVTLDDTDTKSLLQMAWETEAYLYRIRDRLEDLASMLVLDTSPSPSV